MRNWLKNVLGGGPPQTPDVPEAWIEGLRGILAPLRKWKGKILPAGLDDRVIEYVVHGEPLSVLGELQSPDVEEAVFGRHLRDGNDVIDKVYSKFEEVPAEVGLRWALVLEAITKGVRYHHSNFLFPGAVTWPEQLLIAGTGNSPRVWTSNETQRLSYRAFERLFAVAGIEPEALIVSAFGTPAHVGYGTSGRLQMVTKLLDYPDALDRHLEKVRPHLLTAMATQRVHVLDMLNTALPETLARVAPEIAELAVSSSKQVRNGAEILVKGSGDAAIAPLKEFAQRGKPEQRQYALRLLHDLAVKKSDETLRTFARETAQADKAESVRGLIAEWDSNQAAAATDNSLYEYSVPKIDWSSAMTPEVPALLDDLWRTMNATIDASNRGSREHHERMLAQGHKYPLHLMAELPDAKLKMLRAMLADGKAPAPEYGSDSPNWHIAHEIPKFVANGKLPPTALYKILAGLNLLNRHDNNLNQAATRAFDVLYASRGGFTLLEVSKMFEDGGINPVSLLLSYCSQFNGIAHEWRNEDVWPFFAHHVEDLERLLVSGPVGYWFDRSLVYRAISTLPTPPARIVNALFNVALGTGKSERLSAQAALAAHPDKEARIINALSEGKSEVRMAAAQWLGRLKHQPAIPALTRAVMEEKHDTAKGAMLDALEILGEPVEKFLKRDALAAEAKKVLAKGIPKDVEWFPWNALPEVHWADTKEPVPADVLRWMLVQAVRQKSAEPNAVLRKYCAMFDAREREQLGQMILDSWLRQDVTPIAPEEARTRAHATAQSTFGYMQSHPQYWKDNPLFGKSVAELEAIYLPPLLRTPAGSAIASKGVLAVAAACAAERAGAPVGRYIKEWYGTRAAQGKALIAMLAWVDHPSATQVMLSIGSRFRTKSFQEEATRQAEALAERRAGRWPSSPIAPFPPPASTKTASSSCRTARAASPRGCCRTSRWSSTTRRQEGRLAARAAAGRRRRARQGVEEGVQRREEGDQGHRRAADRPALRSAVHGTRLAVRRTGSDYLNRHPVVRHLAAAAGVDRAARRRREQLVFRPLDDGTLTSRGRRRSNCRRMRAFGVAHDSLLSPEDRFPLAPAPARLRDRAAVPAARQGHLRRCRMRRSKPARSRISRVTCSKPSRFAAARSSSATRAAPRRTAAGFTSTTSASRRWASWPSSNSRAIRCPRRIAPVALLSLSFAASQADRRRRGRARQDVPGVLLSECYNDLRLIAAEGTGFDPDWQKKSEY